MLRCLLPLSAVLVSGLHAQDRIDFDRDVRPILAENCFQCHGPDERKRKAGLRLDQRETAFANRDGVRAIVAERPDDSELVRRILATDEDVHMPPADSGRKLSVSQRQTLVNWIEQGAAWQEHWAFRPIREIEALDGIDGFVTARAFAAGLELAPEADRASLIRRVTLDLTGIPPTPQEVASFVADESKDSYAKLVNRLLESPRYGEHMARFWLDAARYGDTHGLHLDNYREMWPYRDWVIEAFNQNVPYDQFVIEQLAGDLLSEPSLDQQVASGFCRAHVSTNEGGAIKEEVYVRNVSDRVDTYGTVFLGLSVGCAMCHDHKFDPITQRDYYSLFAFFNNIDGGPMDGNRKDHAPVVTVPTERTAEREAELTDRRTQIETELNEALAAIDYVEPPAGSERRPHQEFVWIDDSLPTKNTGQPFEWVATPRRSGGKAIRRSGEGLHQTVVQGSASKLRIGEEDKLFAWVWLDPTNPPKQIMLQWNDGSSWEHRATWGDALIPWGQRGTASQRAFGALPQTGRWVRLEVPAQSVGLMPGTIVDGIAFTQHGGAAVWDAAGIVSHLPQQPEDVVWIDDETPAQAQRQGDGKTWRWVTGPKHPVHSGARSLRRSGGGGLNQDFFTGANPPLRVQAGDKLFAHVYLDPKNPPRGIQLQFNNGNWEHRVRWGAEAHGPGRKNGGDHVAGALPETGRWVRLEVDAQTVGIKPGDLINGWAFTQVGGTVYWDTAGISGWAWRDQRWRESFTAWTRLAVSDNRVPKDLRAIAKQGEAKRSSTDQDRLLRHYLRTVHAESKQKLQPFTARLSRVDDELKKLRSSIPTTMVMKERMEPRPAFMLMRGEYDNRGDRVERATPSFLPPMPATMPRNRLGLAQWTVAPDNPLTARVMVNRLWQQFFGTGLVKTAEDFGNQGSRPTHPELLDWLARRFVQEGWDIKRTVRRLVMSKSYRRAQGATAEAWRIDPENRWLARGARFRLDAETLRDQALSLSGLLVEQLGGTPVKPPQPAGLWRAVGYSSSNTAKFRADAGREKVHRRSIYTFWKRTAPPPQFTTFDAPSRETCVVRRERTNTPLQALLLLNDPQYLECARGLAQRTLTEVRGDDRKRLAWALQLVTTRAADPRDVEDLARLLQSQRDKFRSDADGARALTGIGEAPRPDGLDDAELAAWTVISNLLLNLDEVLNRS